MTWAATPPLPPSEGEEKQKLSAKLLDTVSGIFAPVVPLITGAGMIKAILTILVVFGLPNDSQEYTILNFIADSGFYFFPVVLAFSSAKKFGCNPYLAAMIGGVLIHPTWTSLVSAGDPVSFFGIPVKLNNYGSSVLPIILTVLFMSFVERFAEKVSPNMVKAILKPLITMAVTALVSLIVLAPLRSYIGGILAGAISFLDQNVPVLVPTIVGGIQPSLVFFGRHLAIFPPLQTIQLAEMGYETVCGPGFLAAVLACSGAAIGFGLRTRDKNAKELAFSTGFTAFVISLVAAYLLSGDKKKSAQPAAPQDADLHPTDTAAAHTLYAPLTGTVIPLEEVPDETFSAGILGQGLAIRPDDPTVYAPFDGTVIQTVDSKHAVGLRSADGMEVLIHVGIDTVDMNGQGFTLYCKEGDTVRRGQRLLTFDPKAIEAAGHPTVTVVIVTNSDDYQAVIPPQDRPCRRHGPGPDCGRINQLIERHPAKAFAGCLL